MLVLGLNGAGKSSILLGLTGSSAPLTPQPNEGFNVVCLSTAKVPMSFWESKYLHVLVVLNLLLFYYLASGVNFSDVWFTCVVEPLNEEQLTSMCSQTAEFSRAKFGQNRP